MQQVLKILKEAPSHCAKCVCSPEISLIVNKLLMSGIIHMLIIDMLAGKREEKSDLVLIWLACSVFLLIFSGKLLVVSA